MIQPAFEGISNSKLHASLTSFNYLLIIYCYPGSLLSMSPPIRSETAYSSPSKMGRTSASVKLISKLSNTSPMSTNSQSLAVPIISETCIESLPGDISRQLLSQESLTNRLEAWLRNINPSTYIGESGRWPPIVRKEYEAYKGLGDQLAAAHKKYKEVRCQYKTRIYNLTPDEHICLAQLANDWAKAALRLEKYIRAIM